MKEKELKQLEVAQQEAEEKRELREAGELQLCMSRWLLL
jgi:hypothetical protein